MYEYNAKMIHVVDGDTMDFEVDLGFKIKQILRVRLLNVDTPEIYHPKCPEEKEHGQKATNFVKSVAEGVQGVLRTQKDRKGKYGRYLAEFFFEYHDETVEIGNLLAYHGFAKKDVY